MSLCGAPGLRIRRITRWAPLLQGHRPLPADLRELPRVCRPAPREELSLGCPGELQGNVPSAIRAVQS